MKTPPAGIGERHLSAALHKNWGLAPVEVTYAAVGFGDHHWTVTDGAGRRWFVTVAALAGGWRAAGAADGYADLRAAMSTAVALTEAGLDLAVAPVPTAAGEPLAPLGAEHAITVFPYLDGPRADFGDEMPQSDRLTLIRLLARLHDATALVQGIAPVRHPELASRPVLRAALGALGEQWEGGPYSEPARELLARHAAPLERALAHFDELLREATASGPAVLTHGEPHPGNIMRVAGTMRLIDWDTAGLALPERDLWGLAPGGSREAEHYAALTGHDISDAAMRMYELRWSLDEIALYVEDFRRPHGNTDDTELSWTTFIEEIRSAVRFTT